MKNFLKNEQGVTMIILVLMIIIILIMATVGIYSGIDAYKSMKVQTFIAQMQLIREKINIVKEEYKAWDDYNGTNLDAFIIQNYGYTNDNDEYVEPVKIASYASTNPIREKFEDVLATDSYINGEDKVLANYFYFSKDDLEKVFGLKNLDINVIINFNTGTFVERDGVEITTLFGKDAETHTLNAAISLINRGYFSSDTFVDDTAEESSTVIQISSIQLLENTASKTSLRLKLNNIAEIIEIQYAKENNNDWANIDSYNLTNTILEFDLPSYNVGKYVFKILLSNGVEIVSDAFEITKVNPPKLINSEMLPISIDDTGAAEVINNVSSTVDWYNYSSSEKRWANAIFPDKSIYVWIPRFAYKLYDDRIDIIFLEESSTHGFGDGTNVETLGYTIHPAFMKNNSSYENGEYNRELTGIWVSKFDNFVEKNISQVNANEPEFIFHSYANQNLSKSEKINFVQAINNTRKIEMFLNLYGFTTNNNNNNNIPILDNDFKFNNDTNSIDTHLIKNSEYGALLYLAHSNYGIGILSLNYIQDDYTGGELGITKNLNSSTTGTVYGVYDLTNKYPDYVAAGTANYLKGNGSVQVYGKAQSNEYITIYSDREENARAIGDCMIDSKIFGFFRAQVIRQEYFVADKGILSRGGKTEFDYVATSFSEVDDSGNEMQYGIRTVLVVF